MSIAAQLLADIRSRGAVFRAEGDRLRWKAPRGALTDYDRQALAAHKPEILELVAITGFDARLYDTAARRPWEPTFAWSDVPPGATVPIWAEEWEQPDGTSWARAPHGCVPESSPDRASVLREPLSYSTKITGLEELKALASVETDLEEVTDGEWR